ncbi:GDSL-type esterase/lipase family protein [Rufibacter sp. LB8]|uniref:SGNH/GDSL hydrolase family protein n=1 Tax=Rufibacter sp. LB8 TaxID=2777781 RepID=UPI00178C7EDF|nr:GDSL-type esterase/lipase family protein [Rufibacter sp. LB8]
MRSILFSLLLSGLALFSSCQGKDEDDPLEDLPGPGASASYVALGDAYTLGDGIATANRWPMHLSRLLATENLQVGEPLVIAKAGWTSNELATYLRSVALPNDYGMISLQIGMNDLLQNRTVDAFRIDFRALLSLSTNMARKNAKKVLVLTIPDFSALPSASSQNRTQISGQIKKFNDIIRAEAQAAGIAVGDVNDLSLKVVQDPSLLTPDGLHYSSAMYLQWAQRVQPLAKTIMLN